MTVCILGGPFSGKTTQAKLIARRYGLTYISVDEILNGETLDVKQAVGILKKGKYITPEIYTEIIRIAIENGKKSVVDKIITKGL
jgi:adenylate kinase family enzyme